MGQEKRFGKRIAEPSSVQIVHELKLMALRQSLDAATAREAAEAPAVPSPAVPSPAVAAAGSHVRVRDAAAPAPSPSGEL